VASGSLERSRPESANVRNPWKVFGIAVICLALMGGAVSAAFLLGRSSSPSTTVETADDGTVNAAASTTEVAREDVPASSALASPTTSPPTTAPRGLLWADELLLKWRESDPSLHAAMGYTGPIPATSTDNYAVLNGIRGYLAGASQAICRDLTESGARMSDELAWGPQEMNGRQLNAEEVSRFNADLVTERCPENL
jgi:hypothetical protein